MTRRPSCGQPTLAAGTRLAITGPIMDFQETAQQDRYKTLKVVGWLVVALVMMVLIEVLSEANEAKWDRHGHRIASVESASSQQGGLS